MPWINYNKIKYCSKIKIVNIITKSQKRKIQKNKGLVQCCLHKFSKQCMRVYRYVYIQLYKNYIQNKDFFWKWRQWN